MIPPFCDDSTVPGLIPPGHAMEPRPGGVSSRIRSNSSAPEIESPQTLHVQRHHDHHAFMINIT